MAMELKLKQASAALGVAPKELQNLVQFGVLRPPLRDRVFWYNRSALFRARILLYVKDTLDTSYEALKRLNEIPDSSFRRDVMTLTCKSPSSPGSLRLQIPARRLVEDVEKRLPAAEKILDLPRGRQRPGWKQEFLDATAAAGSSMNDLSVDEILRIIEKDRASRSKRQRVETKRGKATGRR